VFRVFCVFRGHLFRIARRTITTKYTNHPVRPSAATKSNSFLAFRRFRGLSLHIQKERNHERRERHENEIREKIRIQDGDILDAV
jgi:hypothetical protein